jgi:NAD(P)H-nitrite reductase large subunit
MIGNGIADITTARHLRQQNPDLSIRVLPGESAHFYSCTVLMCVFMGYLRYDHIKSYEDWFRAKNRIILKRTMVQRIDADAKQIHCDDGTAINYDALVIATGSIPARCVGPSAGEEIPAQFVGVGVVPNVGFLVRSDVAVGKGVPVNKFLRPAYRACIRSATATSSL